MVGLVLAAGVEDGGGDLAGGVGGAFWGVGPALLVPLLVDEPVAAGPLLDVGAPAQRGLLGLLSIYQCFGWGVACT